MRVSSWATQCSTTSALRSTWTRISAAAASARPAAVASTISMCSSIVVSIRWGTVKSWMRTTRMRSLMSCRCATAARLPAATASASWKSSSRWTKSGSGSAGPSAVRSARISRHSAASASSTSEGTVAAARRTTRSSTTIRSSYRSRIVETRGGRGRMPPCGSRCRWPSPSRRRSASRTGVRLTPKRSASCSSTSRSP